MFFSCSYNENNYIRQHYLLYIYIYMCVCVCVCVCSALRNAELQDDII